MFYDAIIIGAGAGGIFAAFKLACSGKKILLIEKQPQPGGYATVFKRRGFTFEAAVHSVDSMGKGGEVRDFLEEHGLGKEVEFIKLREFGRLIFPEHNCIVTGERGDFINYLKKTFPQEEKNIDALFKEFDKFYRHLDRYCASNLPDWLKLALTPFAYFYIIKMSIFTIGHLIDKYIGDKKLKGIISAIWGFLGLPPDKLSAFYFLIIFRGYYLASTDYIRGGFIRLFDAMVKKIRESGSEVIFNAAVTKIVTDNGRRVKSVVTDKGKEFSAGVVISNANPIDTLCRFVDCATVRESYSRKLPALEKSLSAFQVYLGLKAPAKELGMDAAMFCLNTSYDHEMAFTYSMAGDYDRCQLAVVDHVQADPGLVPPGKGSLLIFVLDNYSNWQGFSEEGYKAKKMEAANKLIARVEKYLPGLSAQIEVMEAATPLTMERYSSCPAGAIYGFAQTVEQASINRLKQSTKIKGLILSGAWTRPGGGIHGVFVSAMDAADMALRLLK